jgi:hypothetical protein
VPLVLSFYSVQSTIIGQILCLPPLPILSRYGTNQSMLPARFSTLYTYRFSYCGLRQNRAHLKPYIPYLDRNNHIRQIQFIGSIGPRQYWIGPDFHAVRYSYWKG